MSSFEPKRRSRDTRIKSRPTMRSTMKRRLQWGFASLLTVISMLAYAGEPASEEVKKPGQWDVNAVYLWPGPTAIADAPDRPRIATVKSPSEKLALLINENDLIVSGRDGARVAGPIKIDDLVEVSWSPGSLHFAVTASDGGWVGSWTATVYTLAQTGMNRFDASPLIAARFQSRKGGCDEVPNVAAAGWLGPDVLLVVAQAPPHSSCNDMGTFRGYELSIRDRRIQREYDASELLSKFSNRLGPRLKG